MRNCKTCQHLKRPEIDRRLVAGDLIEFSPEIATLSQPCFLGLLNDPINSSEYSSLRVSLDRSSATAPLPRAASFDASPRQFFRCRVNAEASSMTSKALAGDQRILSGGRIVNRQFSASQGPLFIAVLPELLSLLAIWLEHQDVVPQSCDFQQVHMSVKAIYRGATSMTATSV